MKQIKIGKYIAFTELSDMDILKLMKLQVNMDIGFVNFETKKFSDKQIPLRDRNLYSSDDFKNIINQINEEFELNTEDDYYDIVFLLNPSIYNSNKELFHILKNIPDYIFETCKYIAYKKKGDIFIVEFPKNLDNTSNKFIYYNSNDTYLVFSSEGPKLVTDDPSINNIVDLLKKVK